MERALSGHASHVPGRCQLGAAPALTAGALAFNVYFLRIHHPGLISGKLSDLAINFVLPVALVAAIEWIAAIVSHFRGERFVPASWRARVIACAVGATYFALLQLAPPASVNRMRRPSRGSIDSPASLSDRSCDGSDHRVRRSASAAGRQVVHGPDNTPATALWLRARRR